MVLNHSNTFRVNELLRDSPTSPSSIILQNKQTNCKNSRASRSLLDSKLNRAYYNRIVFIFIVM